MKERHILVLTTPESPWRAFLGEFFEDTPAHLHLFSDAAEAGALVQRQPPDAAFVDSGLLTLPLSQKLKVLRASQEGARLFHLGQEVRERGSLSFDKTFAAPEDLGQFQKNLVLHLPMPETIRLLVVDDEPGVGQMMRDFFEGRAHPSFSVRHTDDGAAALQILGQGGFDVLILDIKMPAMDGREVYRQIRENQIPIPVIIYFDAISGDEIGEIRQIGNPAVVEKGSSTSTMVEIMALIKKKVYFG